MQTPSQTPLDSARAALLAGRHADALAAAKTCLDLDPQNDAARRLRAEALGQIDLASAAVAWQEISREQPGDPEAHFHLGNLARARADDAAAIRHYETALESVPQNPAVLNNLGLAYEALKELEKAESCFRNALDSPGSGTDALANLAQNLFLQKRYAEALVLFDRLTDELGIDIAAIWANRAICQRECGKFGSAISSFNRALALAPEATSLWRDLLLVCCEVREYEEAYRANERLQAMGSPSELSDSDLLYTEMALAIWTELPARRARQIALAAKRFGGESSGGAEHPQPFQLQAICDDPACLLASARSATEGLAVCQPTIRPSRSRGAPIRLGFAGSFHPEHPVSRLLVNLLEHIDRAQYELFVYAADREGDNPMRRRIGAACSEYRNAGESDFDEFADLVRRDSIDILFDLNGYTETELLRVFALRPAPVQINFLGFTGSMGNAVYDHLITDHFCMGDYDSRNVVERPLYIDPCYLPSDSVRVIDPSPLRRGDYGLPDSSIVCCAMAPIYKIVPEMFDVWMSVMEANPLAVLWLRDASESITGRLRREAARRGADPMRLHFAPREAESRYLARFRLADVFLDTAPFGAHTTVNDAIYAGLPVLTMRGSCFHSRASASQAVTAGLGDLVATDLADYANLARRMCVDSGWRRQMTARARAARAGPLFDMASYARKFEECMAVAWHDRL